MSPHPLPEEGVRPPSGVITLHLTSNLVLSPGSSPVWPVEAPAFAESGVDRAYRGGDPTIAASGVAKAPPACSIPTSDEFSHTSAHSRKW
ncbi:hypothetical protein SUDANB1_00864 [Streptomyces sp. enrichment culture]